MNTISKEEAAVAQQKVDQIQQACAVLNKIIPNEYGYVLDGMLNDTRMLNRAIVNEASQ